MITVVTISKNADNPTGASWVPIDQLIGPVAVGADTMVIEGYTGDIADGTIAEIDDLGGRVRVDVDWATLRTIVDEPYDTVEGGSDFESSAARFGGKAMGPGGVRWGFEHPAPRKMSPAPPPAAP